MFPKRRNTEQDGDAFICHKVSENFGMNAYMCIFNEGEDNSDNLKKVAESVCQVMNKYAAIRSNNANPVEYRGDISTNVPDSQRQSVDHYIITKGVVNFVENYYSEEIADGLFHLDLELIHALFGRNMNTDDINAILSRY